MNKTLIAIASVCIVIAMLSPIAAYTYISNTVEPYTSQIESYELQISELQISLQEAEEFKEKIKEFMKPLPYDPYLMEPYLVTELGWYLHDSSDPINESRNKLTIYGQVLNIGAEKAYNCKLVVKFYKSNTVVQTSEINIGTIRYWDFYYTKKDIDCELADSVTRIKVERFWSNTP
jgi:hypothetical protein